MVRVSFPAKLRPWSELTAKMVMGVVPGLVRRVLGVRVFFRKPRADLQGSAMRLQFSGLTKCQLSSFYWDLPTIYKTQSPEKKKPNVWKKSSEQRPKKSQSQKIAAVWNRKILENRDAPKCKIQLWRIQPERKRKGGFVKGEKSAKF